METKPLVWIIGATGYVGSFFAEELTKRGIPFCTDRVDITSTIDVSLAICDIRPTHVINCAGITGTPNVDWCEDHAPETFAVNVKAPLSLALTCSANRAHFTQIGSGCIYDKDNGGKGWGEDDLPNYCGSVYSYSKICMESMLRAYNYLNLRIRIPISAKPHKKNALTKLLAYEHTTRNRNSYTIMEDFIPRATDMILKNELGTYNMTNMGWTTNEQILRTYNLVATEKKEIKIMDKHDLLQTLKAGRSDCVLNTDKAVDSGYGMPEVSTRMCDITSQYVDSVYSGDEDKG